MDEIVCIFSRGYKDTPTRSPSFAISTTEGFSLQELSMAFSKKVTPYGPRSVILYKLTALLSRGLFYPPSGCALRSFVGLRHGKLHQFPVLSVEEPAFCLVMII